jgi:hypothetical protein
MSPRTRNPSSLDVPSRPSRARLPALLCVVGLGVLPLAACGDDEPNDNIQPSTPAGSVFGTTAPVDNSTVNNGDTPVEENEVPAP